MTRRPGMTMTEALVAIFVVAIGLTGVMSTFPFAASQMSHALVSDRTVSASGSIDGFFRSYWKDKVVEDPAQQGGNEPFWTALENPGVHPTTGAALPAILPSSSEVSYPVFVDAMGVVGRGGTNQSWVGDVGSLSFVPRRNINLVANSGDPQRLSLRLFSQADGFSWDEDSQPRTGAEMRELRYNSLCVVQRITNRDRYQATLKVVVFDKRRHLFYPTGAEQVFPNATYPAAIRFTPGSTLVTIPTAADVKKGSWIMDGTVQTAAPFIRHANFYRVVSATENTAGLYDVELHTPIRRVDGRNTAADFYDGTVVVVAGIADVFDRPALTGSTGP